MRLLIVSNRLPFTVTERGGEVKFQRSVGGVATGLGAYLESLPRSELKFSEHLWIGWPGISVPPRKQKAIRKTALKNYRALPVFFSEGAMEKFYHGFCNKTLWPLFHYFPNYVVYDEGFWRQYVRVNEAFARVVLSILKPDDVVWVHDYQLMLLPGFLRRKRPEVPVGFFLHIPFPSFEMFQVLPRRWGRELLAGLLGADLVGLHTHDYTQNFMKSVLRIAGHGYHLGHVVAGERLVKAEAYPIGIDYEKFSRAACSAEVEAKRREMQATFSGAKSIFSVDRLDYTKGILNRLKGFALFLEKYPKWREKVVFNLVVVPSRTGVESYQLMKKEIDAMVGRINGRFGSVRWTPVVYQYKSLSFESLIARYSHADVGLITPLRDGMNLVAKEFVASRHRQDGVLILSEMTGAAKELAEALLVNPNDIEQIAQALDEALRLPAALQKQKMALMQRRLSRYNILRWAEHFLYDLLAVKREQKQFQSRLFNGSLQKELMENFSRADWRLIFLDYDGTLVHFTEDPAQARPPAELLRVLRKLAKKPKTGLVIISGRDKETLQKWLGTLPVGLVAEHGAWIYQRGEWMLSKPVRAEWKAKVYPILEIFADRLPGALIEEKEHAICWHYRKADPEQGERMAKELTDDLIQFSAGMDMEVLQGNRIVEVRSRGVDKGSAGLHFLSQRNYEFVLAIGDDTTDEDLFAALPASSFTLRVGMVPSRARYNIRSPAEVLGLLKALSR